MTELFNEGVGYSTLNTVRSSLSTIIKTENGTIGSHWLVSRFMKGISEIRPSIPRYSGTWDVNLILDYFDKLGINDDLSLELLTKKVTVLLLILSGQRVQTPHLLKVNQISFNKNDCVIRVTGSDQDKLKHFNAKKNVQVMTFEKYDDKKLCFVTCLQDYLKRTAGHRNSDYLLLCFKKPYGHASKDTISRWLKCVMKEVGIDTKVFGPHSVRGASTSAAAKLEVPLNTILQAAGWSNAQTFKKFYFKDVHTCNQKNEKMNSTKEFGNSILKYFSERKKDI